VKPVDGDGEEKANFREAGDGIGPAEDHESVLDNDEKVVEIHAPDLKGKPFDGGVAGKVKFEDAVVADMGAAIMLIAERDSAAELARGHEVAAKSSRFGLGHRWFSFRSGPDCASSETCFLPQQAKTKRAWSPVRVVAPVVTKAAFQEQRKKTADGAVF